MERLKISFNKLMFFLLKPFMLALYFWVIVWYFIPDYFKKYTAEIINTQTVNDNYKEYFHDMDSNGFSEIVRSLYNLGGETPAISYFDTDGSIINQWNLRGMWLLNQKLFFGDYDHNGYKEVYCITIVGDSIFLNVKELLLANGLEIEEQFICRTKIYQVDKVDAYVVDASTMDVNNDGEDEFVFSLFSGFSNQPRNTFVYNITSGVVIESPQSASGFNNKLQFMDINDDGVDEITGNINAVENIHAEIPYTDSCSWLMVLDPADSLNFLFSPIKYEGVFGGIQPFLYTIEGEKYIVSTFSCRSVGNEINGIVLQIFDSKGNLINEKTVPFERYGELNIFNPLNGDKKHIYLINEYGVIFISDLSLNIDFLSDPNIEGLIINMTKSLHLDIDGDGEKEILFIATRPSPEKLIIYRSNLKESTIVNLPESKRIVNWHVTFKKYSGSAPLVVLQAENDIYYIEYSKSKYYLLKYPAYVLVYLLLFVLFWLMQNVQNKLAQRRFEEERQLMKQQMALSKRQLEPHFMLNTLNNIGYMFSKENKEDAQYYFGKFASLLHRGLKYADQVETTLYEELEFVRDYLILQKQRFDDDLDFSIESEDDINLNNIRIPHSLVFTFVENAIKHGLRHKISNRNIRIQISSTSSQTEIVITDNGIGRKESKVLKTTGTGKGLAIVTKIIEGYNKLNNRSLSYYVKDLVNDNGKSTGTEVRIVA